MSEPAASASPFYVTGGTLKPGEPSYVERRADTELLESLLAGEFCYVLTARQMGKSSLMARTAARLEQAGVRSAIVDLTQIGSERGAQAAEQWYFGVANRIHQQLRIAEPLRPWWQERSDLSSVQRLTDFFRELVLAHCPGRIVVFVDEIDSTIGLPFADDFFAALRACFNARATEPAFERLTFVLLGVATPDQLIQDPARTPFNIGKRIDLADFSPDEARGLAPGLHSDPGEADRRLERVLHWTGGHPYLTQALCRAVREKGQAAEIDAQVEELFFTSQAQQEETNLKHARARLERPGPEGRRLLQLYRRVREGKPVPDQPTSPLFAQLKLAGVVKATDEGQLAVRNRIYEVVFTPEWAKASMPPDRGRQFAIATLNALLAGLLIWYAIFQPRPYIEILQTAREDYPVAANAYEALRSNLIARFMADELMAQFWSHKAWGAAERGKRDESLVAWLQALKLSDTDWRRKEVRHLLGNDYKMLVRTLRYEGPGETIALSPGGRMVLIGSADGTAWVWETSTGSPVAGPLRHRKGIQAATFSADGKIVLTASEGEVRIWNVASGAPVVPPFKRDVVSYSIRIDSESRSAPTDPVKGSILASDTLAGRYWPIHEASELAVALSPDAHTILFGGSDTVDLWDMNSQSLRVLRPLSPILSFTFSPDGQSVLIGTNGGARVWDVRTGKPQTPTMGQGQSFNSVYFSPDGKVAVTVSLERFYLWDVSSGKLIVSPRIHTLPITCLAFSSDSSMGVSASADGMAWLWDTHTGKQIGQPIQHHGKVLAAVFSSDGAKVLTGSADGTARLWSTKTGKPISQPFMHQMAVTAVAFGPNGAIVTGSADDAVVRVWEPREEPITSSLEYEGFVIILAAFSPDGSTLLTGAADGTARLWDARTLRPRAPPIEYDYPIIAAAFSHDSNQLLLSARDGTARIWNARSGQPLTSSLELWPPVTAVALGRRAAFLGSWDGIVRIWDKPRSGISVKHSLPITAIAISPDDRFLLTGSDDNTARLWDSKSGKPLIKPIRHRSSVTAVAFSPDGTVLLIGTQDGTVRLWDRYTGKPMTHEFPHQGLIANVAFNSTGTSFLVATDRWLNVYSWKMSTRRLSAKREEVHLELSRKRIYLLQGTWKGATYFPSDCEECVRVALGEAGNSMHVETFEFGKIKDSPLHGNPSDLLIEWQRRLGLHFDERMSIVP